MAEILTTSDPDFPIELRTLQVRNRLPLNAAIKLCDDLREAIDHFVPDADDVLKVRARAGEVAWRVDAIRDELMSHAYGLDEWSTPVVNLKRLGEYIKLHTGDGMEGAADAQVRDHRQH